MMIHHSFDYFYTHTFLYRYVRFITGLFIFITGFIITNVYLKKYNVLEHSNKISKRLLIRGNKILALFVVMNFILKLATYDYSTLTNNFNPSFASYLYKIFITGSYKIADFAILLPISYLLLIFCFLVSLKNKIYLIIPLSFLLFIYCSIKYLYQDGAFNLRFITIGLIGSSFGLVHRDKYEKISSMWFVIIPSFLTLIVVSSFYRLIYPLYVLLITANYFFIYLIISCIGKLDLRLVQLKMCVLLGKHTLFGYIVQIAILQMILRLHILHFKSSLNFFFAFLSTLVLTITLVYLLNWMKEKYTFVNNIYRFVFS